MSTGPLPISNFYLPSGSPVANGYMMVSISSDAQLLGSQICAGIPARVELDANGAPIGNPVFPISSLLSPGDIYYEVRVYNSEGVLIYKEDSLTLVPFPPITTGGFGTAFGSYFGS